MNKEAQAQSENKPVSPMPPAAALKLHLESCNQRSRIFDMMKMLHTAGNLAETTSGRIPHIHIGVCAWAAAHQCIAAAQSFQAETDADNVIFPATRSASARPLKSFLKVFEGTVFVVGRRRCMPILHKADTHAQ